MDVTKPSLKAINVVVRKNDPPLTVFLLYERLSDFYLNFGLFDHVPRVSYVTSSDPNNSPNN